jgi:hypothetical protein
MSIRMRFMAAPVAVAALALAGPVSGASAAVPTVGLPAPVLAAPTVTLSPAFQAGADAAVAGWTAGAVAAQGGFQAGAAALRSVLPTVGLPFAPLS